MSLCNNVNQGSGDLVTFGGANVDAFGRLRVSNPVTIFDATNVMSKNTLFAESTANGGTVTYTANKSTVNLNITEAAGSEVIRQSKRVMSYQPGKSLYILASFVMNTPTTNLSQKIGLFDANNGIFFEAKGTTYQFVRRTYTSGAAVDTEVAQSSWNGDKLNGTGASGFTLNPDTANIFYCDLEWLGVGAVRVGFVINGQFIICHTFYNANNLTTVYMQTANLPIRYQINRTGTLSAGTYTMQQICSTCMTEGGYAPEARQQMIGTASLGGVNLTTAGTLYNLATIRIKSNRPYAVIVPEGYEASAVSNSDFELYLLLNATPSASFSYTSYSDNVEYDLTGTTTITGGTRIGGSFISGKGTSLVTSSQSGAFNFSYQLGQTIAGVSDTLTLAAKGAANNDDVVGMLKWYDLTLTG